MGLLRELTADEAGGTTADAGPLRDLVSAMVTADGEVDVAEHITVEALWETVPQLRGAPHDESPPIASRKALFASLGRLTDRKLRHQLFVLAVDLALASGGAHEREDVFLTELQQALGIEEDFARQAITILSYKYARAR